MYLVFCNFITCADLCDNVLINHLSVCSNILHFFKLSSCCCSLCILAINPLSKIYKVFSHCASCIFALLIVSFAQQFLILMKSNSLILFLLLPELWCPGQEIPSNSSVLRHCLLCFFLGVLKFPLFPFRALVPLELCIWYNFTVWYVKIQNHLSKKLFPHWIDLAFNRVFCKANVFTFEKSYVAELPFYRSRFWCQA